MPHDNNLNFKNPSQGPNHSLPPSLLINQAVVSSHRPSTRSTGGSSPSNSRARRSSNGRSSIQMEPGLQALLAAEGRAAEMIVTARTKRTELMRQANRESQVEIEAFRKECESQYQFKLREATQLEQFQAKLDIERLQLLEQMKKHAKKERKSLVNYIMHCVIDQIPVGPHPNTKRVIF
jgi:ATP synthase subunit G